MQTTLTIADQLELAWNPSTNLVQIVECADYWVQNGRPLLAASLYQTWIESRDDPNRHLACFNLGTLLLGLNRIHEAQNALEQAISRHSDFFQARINLGLVYEKLGKIDDAINQWRYTADHTNPATPEQKNIAITALNNIGRLQEIRKNYRDATTALTRSLILNPEQPDTIHHWIFQRAKQCEWPVLSGLPNITEKKLRQHTSALAMIALSDDPEEQLNAARNFVQNKLNTANVLPINAQKYRHEKIRIGYCSSDFCQHPVSMLMAELFEQHDRSKFEIHAFDWSPDDHSPLRQRILSGFDKIHDIRTLRDDEAARLIHSKEIDILVDLHGQTHGARPLIFAYRPAPMQITYLGLPATTGFPFIDYVIADKYLIPPSLAKYYTEHPLYMPSVYQVSDTKRTASTPLSRKEYGLPENAKVLCCMNNNYKITPEIFQIWMKILKSNPDTVLWLLEDNPYAKENLLKNAKNLKVDSSRIVFAQRTNPPDYLARYACADLYIDTYPFNAGTTANDVLWMELPIVTLSGRTFGSRMAGALLHCAGLDELITNSYEEYYRLINTLLNDDHALSNIKSKVRNAKLNSPLFNIKEWVKGYEKALLDVYLGPTENAN